MATFTKRGTSWHCQIRRKGNKPICKTFATKPEAERWASTIESRIEQDTYQDVRPSLKVTLADCLKRYSNEITPFKKGHRRETDRIRRWLKQPLSSKPMGAIKSFDIAAWRDESLQAGLSPSTITKELALLSHVFTIAVNEWAIPLTNPVKTVRKPRISNTRDRRLEPGEFERLFEHCSDELRAWVVLSIETAMRRGEQHSLKRNMVRGRIIHLADTKNGLSRAVPLSSTAFQTLARLTPRIDGSFWNHPIDYYTHSFNKACRMADIEGLRLHDLRREGCTRLLEKGLSVFEVKSISGYRSTRMLERYIKIYTDELLAKLG